MFREGRAYWEVGGGVLSCDEVFVKQFYIIHTILAKELMEKNRGPLKSSEAAFRKFEETLNFDTIFLIPYFGR